MPYAPYNVPSPNPVIFVVPDSPAPGIFSRAAVQDAVAYSMQKQVDEINKNNAANYIVAWKAYKEARDNNNGLPVANEPEPSPDPQARVVRDSDHNPGIFFDPTVPVATVQTYVPPVFHPSTQLGTSLLVKNEPVGDSFPIGHSFVDVSGTFGPAGVTWTKVSQVTPFGTAVFYQGTYPQA